MSWFSIPKVFTAETKAKAAEVNENFDAVETALNGLFKAGRVNGEALTIGENPARVDVPGSSKTLTLALASLVLIHLEADIELEVGANEKHSASVVLNVDGVDQATGANAGGQGTSIVVEASAAVSYVLTLAAGSHTLKMRAEHAGYLVPGGGARAARFSPISLGYSYLVIPNPEP